MWNKSWFFVKFGWFWKLGGSYAILSSIAFFLFFRFNLISFFLVRIAWRSSLLEIYLTSTGQLVDLYIKVIGTKDILDSVVKKSTVKETKYPHVLKK